jgi:uncharacterized delta-60 repeat protein
MTVMTRTALSICATAVASLALAASASAAAGDLDETFSGDGLVREPTGFSAVTVAGDGSVAVAGMTGGGVSVVFHYKPDGEPSWYVGFGPAVIGALERTSGNDVLMGATNGTGSSANFLVAQLSGATGAVQPGAVGHADFNSGEDRLTDLSVAPNGSVAAAGVVAGPDGRHIGVARWGVDLQPDATFNGGAPLTFADGGGFGEDVAVAALPGGETLVAGAGPAPDGSGVGDLLVARLAADGTLDPAFGGGDGWLTIDVGGRDDARSLVVQPDGKIVVGFEACAVGLHTSCDQAVARLSSSGALDTSFGGDGLVVGTSGSEVGDGGLGRVFVGGYGDPREYFQRDFSISRLLDDGSPDPAFSGDGTATADFDLREDLGLALAVGPDGRPVLGGTSTASGRDAERAVARFEIADGPADADADGVLDADDRCPERASTDKLGCPRIKRKLAATLAGGHLRATIKSIYDFCAARQRLKVVREVDGRKTTFARPRSSATGTWKSPKRVPEGRYRVAVKEKVVGAVARCGKANSRWRAFG